MTMCVRCNATEGQRRPNGWHLCGDCDEEHKREESFELEDKAHNLREEDA